MWNGSLRQTETHQVTPITQLKQEQMRIQKTEWELARDLTNKSAVFIGCVLKISHSYRIRGFTVWNQ